MRLRTVLQARRRRVAGGVVLLTLLAGCSPSSLRVPLGFGGARTADAWLLFQRHCRSCHGSLGAGDGPYAGVFETPAPDLRAPVSEASAREERVGRILRGSDAPGGGMPAFGDVLSGRQAEAIVRLLDELADEGRVGAAAGETIFRDRCASCHGADGAGDGALAAELIPRPRDLTGTRYRFRSTPSGAAPRATDLRRSIEHGLGVTAMGGFAALGPAALDRVTAYVAALTAVTPPAGPTDPAPPAHGPEEVERGRVLYDEARCWQCHGAAGRGDGPSARELRDDAGRASLPANLRRPWRLKGGADPSSLARTIANGMNGTPMPSYGEVLEPDELWALVRYVRSLGDPWPALPAAVPVVAVPLLPIGPDAEAWRSRAPIRVPLGPQAFVAPRWQRPAVDVVDVSLVSTDGRLSVLVAWDDPFEDRSTTDRDAAPEAVYDATRPGRWALPDRLVVRFAPAAAGAVPGLAGAVEGMREWTWSAAVDTPHTAATYDEGRWHVVLTGPTPFGPGALGFVSVRVWEGSQGEAGTRYALSAWVPLRTQES